MAVNMKIANEYQSNDSFTSSENQMRASKSSSSSVGGSKYK